MIWSYELPDGTVLKVDKAYRHLGNKPERRYAVSAVLPSGARRGVCHVGPDGTVRRWYTSKWVRELGTKDSVLVALSEIASVLTVEQVLET